MSGDWKVFRPAIWLGMLGIAVLVLFNAYLGIALVGGAAGIGMRIRTTRRRAARGLPPRGRPARRIGRR